MRLERGTLPSAIAYRLDGGRYFEVERVGTGGLLRLRVPFPVEVDLGGLAPAPAG